MESWINGITWRDLCKETSLDQGDICRMLRRTGTVPVNIQQRLCCRPGKVINILSAELTAMILITVEVLRQIPYAYGIPPKIAELAYEAADKMDRFPVADFADAASYSGSAGIAPETASALLQPDGDENDLSGDDSNSDGLYEEDSLLSMEEVQEIFGLDDDSEGLTLDSFGSFDDVEGDGDGEEDALSSMLESLE